jgi:hypothetical protein
VAQRELLDSDLGAATEELAPCADLLEVRPSIAETPSG